MQPAVFARWRASSRGPAADAPRAVERRPPSHTPGPVRRPLARTSLSSVAQHAKPIAPRHGPTTDSSPTMRLPLALVGFCRGERTDLILAVFWRRAADQRLRRHHGVGCKSLPGLQPSRRLEDLGWDLYGSALAPASQLAADSIRPKARAMI